MSFRIRPADRTRDRAAMLSFIDGLQAFENRVEPNRRLDDTVAAECARGLGAGRALIQACEDWAKARGIGNIQIGVLAKNDRAHAIYNAAGFDDYSVQLRKYL